MSRLIMLSGVPLRKYGPESADDADALARTLKALPSLLTPAEFHEITRRLKQVESAQESS